MGKKKKKNPLANAGDKGLSPGPERFHTSSGATKSVTEPTRPRACASQLESSLTHCN